MPPHDEGVLVVHRTSLPYTPKPQLQGFAPGHLHLERLWLRLADGASVEGPQGPEQAVATSWTARHDGYPHPVPPSVSTARWADKLDGHVARAQSTGAGVLIDLFRGRWKVRALLWAHEEQVLTLGHRLLWVDQVESVGEGRGLWVDYKRGTAELLAPHERRSWRVALPSWLGSGIRESHWGGDERNLFPVPELGLLVFTCRDTVAWMELAALHALPRHPEVRWRTVEHQPRAQLSARVGGTVAFTSPTRVLVNLDDGDQVTLLPFPGLARGQRVVLEGRLISVGGLAHYLWLEYGGERLRLTAEAPGEERVPVEQRALGRPLWRKRPTSYTELAPRLRRLLGLALPEEPEAVKALLQTALGPGTTPGQNLEGEDLFEVVATHLSERLREGRALLYAERLAQEPDELMGRLREAVAPFGIRPRYLSGTRPWELVDDTLPGHTARLAMKRPVHEAVGFINWCLKQKGSDARVHELCSYGYTLWLALSRSDEWQMYKLWSVLSTGHSTRKREVGILCLNYNWE